jgi:Zn-dependent M28 family amino/carboxypeptidase
VPVASISASAAEEILGKKLGDLAGAAIRGGASFDVTGPPVVVGVKTGLEKGLAKNVIALCPGRERKDEAVVLTAHYDHVGTGASGEIYHGADDNASGTAVILAAGKAFASLAERPRRPVYFVAFAGEEKGFLGSQPFVDHPPLPLDSILVNLNLDMVGRGPADEIGVMVGAIDTNLLAVMKGCEAAARIRPKYEVLKPVDGKIPPRTGREKVSLEVPRSRYFGRSDQVVFYRKGIPAAFLFGGTHADYHRPSDTTDKLVYERMLRVGRFVFRTAHRLAESGLAR